MGLLRLQSEFQRELLGEESDIDAAIRPGTGIGVAQRLEIYRYAYRARLRDALRESHGHTARFLGDDAFGDLAGEYVATHPSQEANLRWYGAGFATWLAQRAGEGEGLAQCAALAELAALDWALRGAFDGPDAEVFTLEAAARLAPQAWEGLSFRLLPTATRRRVAFNTLPVWQALDDEQPVPPRHRLEQALDVLIWRRGLQPHFRSLSTFESAALDGVQQGLAFGELCETLARAFPALAVAQEAGALLRRWIDEELLVSPSPAPDTLPRG